MAERKNGLAPVPSNLFRPTAAATPVARPDEDDEPPTPDHGEGRGDAPASPEPRPSRSRRRRAPAGGETKGRKLSLPDSVYDRLQLVAIQRRTTASAVATELLDRNLPRLRIEREG